MDTDRELLEGYRRGDRAALTALYHRHVGEIEKLARSGFRFESKGQGVVFTGYPSASAQQNLVQETFARAFSAAARRSYDGLGPFGAYLRRIAQNLVIDGFRGHGTEPDSPVRGRLFIEASELLADPGPDPEQSLRRDAIIRVVREFVATLPDRERQAMSLRFEQQLTQDQVAHRLRVSRSKVRTLEDRIRRRLHQAMRRSGLVEPLRREAPPAAPREEDP